MKINRANKILSTALCLCIVFALLILTVSATDISRGDMNGDGKVNATDLTLLARFIAGIPTDNPMIGTWICRDGQNYMYEIVLNADGTYISSGCGEDCDEKCFTEHDYYLYSYETGTYIINKDASVTFLRKDIQYTFTGDEVISAISNNYYTVDADFFNVKSSSWQLAQYVQQKLNELDTMVGTWIARDGQSYRYEIVLSNDGTYISSGCGEDCEERCFTELDYLMYKYETGTYVVNADGSITFNRESIRALLDNAVIINSTKDTYTMQAEFFNVKSSSWNLAQYVQQKLDELES